MNLKKHLLGWLAAAFLLSGQSQAAPSFLPPKDLPSSIFCLP